MMYMKYHMWTAELKWNEEQSSQLWTQFMQLSKEARKKFRTSTGFVLVTSRYRCDAITNWSMKPLTLAAGMVKCGFICSRKRDECEWWKWNKSYMNCGNEIRWRMILAVVNAIYAIAQRSTKEIQDFNGVWTRDLAIPVWYSNQMSYEATDVGSRSIVGSYVLVKEMG